MDKKKAVCIDVIRGGNVVRGRRSRGAESIVDLDMDNRPVHFIISDGNEGSAPINVKLRFKMDGVSHDCPIGFFFRIRFAREAGRPSIQLTERHLCYIKATMPSEVSVIKSAGGYAVDPDDLEQWFDNTVRHLGKQ